MTTTLEDVTTDTDIETTRSTTVLRDAVHQLQAQLTALTGERDAATTARDDMASKLTVFWENLEQEADSRGWCDEYDDFAERNGFRRRHHNIQASCTVEVTSELSGDRLLQTTGGQYLMNRETDESMTFVWRFDMDSVAVRVRSGQCGCADLDWDARVRRVLAQHGVTFEDFTTSVSCENDA